MPKGRRAVSSFGLRYSSFLRHWSFRHSSFFREPLTVGRRQRDLVAQRLGGRLRGVLGVQAEQVPLLVPVPPLADVPLVALVLLQREQGAGRRLVAEGVALG